MTTDELRDLLIRSGHESRIRGGEVLVHTCFFCGNDRWNLELNPGKGVYSCWACPASGRLDSLISRYLGKDAHIPVSFSQDRGKGHGPATLPEEPDFETLPVDELVSARTYLERRGLPPHTAAMYGIRVCVEEDHELYGRIVLPMREYWTGDVLGFLGRSYTSKLPKYMATMPERVICGYRVRGRNAPVVLVEGFFDGIAVHRAGFNAAVLGGTTSPDLGAFVGRLAPEIPAAVLLDGSAREEARKLHHRITPVHPKTHLVLLPEHMDPGELHPKALNRLLDRVLSTS